MVFASLAFLYLFLPANLLLYFLLRQPAHRNLLLVAFSLLFYAWGEPVWLSLLLLSTVVDYGIGRALDGHQGTPRARWLLAASMVSNLGLLIAFKYSDFLCGIVRDLTGVALPVPHFTLPIGISFYTFQSISYVVDVYRGEVKAQRSYLNFLLFVSLYHQLVAGPIVRYSHIAGEIDQRTHTTADFARGLSRFVRGLFKKVAIANVAGELVARYLDMGPPHATVAGAWFGVAMFTVQIYFDFSGYSDMAIGLGWMFGFHYHENFDHPYVARTATEFWRRWHMSLSTFFRDYVYIPLGGKHRWATRNLFVVWLLTGLWHGASWNFVLWGLYYAVLLWLERLFLARWLAALPAVVAPVVSHAYLLGVVMLGWALFYFTDLAQLGAWLRLAFGRTDARWHDDLLAYDLKWNAFWLMLAVVACVPSYRALTDWLAPRFETSPRRQAAGQFGVLAWDLGLLAVATAMLVGRSYNPFLYFRF